MSDQTDSKADGGQIVTMDREWQTRDGRKVVLYCVDAPGRWPVHGRVEGEERPNTWEKTGAAFSSLTPLDLVPVPRRVKRAVWLNINKIGCWPHDSSAAADLGASKRDRIACVRADIDVPEGYGLDGDTNENVVEVKA